MRKFLYFLLIIFLVFFNGTNCICNNNKIIFSINKKKFKLNENIYCKVVNPGSKGIFVKISIEAYIKDTNKCTYLWKEVVDNLCKNYKKEYIYEYLDSNNKISYSITKIKNSRKTSRIYPSSKSADGLFLNDRIIRGKFQILWKIKERCRLVLYYKEQENEAWKKIISSEFKIE
jgi:hypothetical protein